MHGAIAQLVEHLLCTQGVRSSTLLGSTIFLPISNRCSLVLASYMGASLTITTCQRAHSMVQVFSLLYKNHLSLLLFSYIFFLLSFVTIPGYHPTRTIYYIIVVLPWIGLAYKDLFASLQTNPVIRLFLVWSGLILISTLIAPNASLNDALHYLRVIIMIGLFLLSTIYVMSNPTTCKNILWLLVICSTVTLIAYMLYFYFHHPLTERFGLFAMAQNPIQVGSLLAVLLTSTLYLFFFTPHNSFREKVILIFCFLIFLIAMILTESRGPSLAFIIGSIALLYTHFRRNIIWVVLAIMLCLGAFITFTSLGQGFLERGLSFRPTIWYESFTLVKDSLFFGLGPTFAHEYILSNGDHVYQPHSIYIASLLYFGIFGSFGFLALIIGTAYLTLHSTHPLRPLAIALGITSLILGSVDYSNLFVNVRTEWFCFWLGLGFCACCSERKSI